MEHWSRVEFIRRRRCVFDFDASVGNGKVQGCLLLFADFLELLEQSLFLLLLLVVLCHHPRALHADGQALLEAAVLTMLPGVLGNVAVLALGAVVGRVCVDAASEERPARVARDGAVVDVVVSHVAADLTDNFADKLGPFSLGLV